MRGLFYNAVFNAQSELLPQSSAFPNKKQTNPSRYGSDLSVLAPVTGLEFQIQLQAILPNVV